MHLPTKVDNTKIDRRKNVTAHPFNLDDDLPPEAPSLHLGYPAIGNATRQSNNSTNNTRSTTMLPIPGGDHLLGCVPSPGSTSASGSTPASGSTSASGSTPELTSKPLESGTHSAFPSARASDRPLMSGLDPTHPPTPMPVTTTPSASLPAWRQDKLITELSGSLKCLKKELQDRLTLYAKDQEQQDLSNQSTINLGGSILVGMKASQGKIKVLEENNLTCSL